MLMVRFWGALGTERRTKTVVTLTAKTQLYFILQVVLDMVLLSNSFSQVCRLGVFMCTFPTLEKNNIAK